MTAETTAGNSIEMLHSDSVQAGQRTAESQLNTHVEPDDMETPELPHTSYLLRLLA
ncbi:hypothetical protein GGI04_005999, partial [Coemansia thaxteri]